MAGCTRSPRVPVALWGVLRLQYALDRRQRPAALDTWPHRTKNQLMFVPDPQVSAATCRVGQPTAGTDSLADRPAAGHAQQVRTPPRPRPLPSPPPGLLRCLPLGRTRHAGGRPPCDPVSSLAPPPQPSEGTSVPGPRPSPRSPCALVFLFPPSLCLQEEVGRLEDAPVRLALTDAPADSPRTAPDPSSPLPAAGAQPLAVRDIGAAALAAAAQLRAAAVAASIATAASASAAVVAAAAAAEAGAVSAAASSLAVVGGSSGGEGPTTAPFALALLSQARCVGSSCAVVVACGPVHCVCACV
jgi:hypothetical protein